MTSPLDWIGADDLRLVLHTPANVLLIGPPDVTSRVVDALVPSLDLPLARCDAAALRLPAWGGGTLIVRDLERLDDADQRRLLAWLDEGARRTRIVSTASTAVFPLVERHAFVDALYYRLNTLSVDVARPAEGRDLG